MTATDLFKAGRLEKAVQALGVELRSDPADSKRRTFLGDFRAVMTNVGVLGRNWMFRRFSTGMPGWVPGVTFQRFTGNEPAAGTWVGQSIYKHGQLYATSLSLNSPRDKNRLLRTIEQTLADFEPRLADVRVRAVDDGSGAPRVLRFQIEGLLKMDPAPEQIFFDTLLQLSTGDCQVKVE